MQLPIYKSNDHRLPLMTQANKGLRFARFFDEYQSDWKVADGVKTGFLKKFAGTCGNNTAIEQVTRRQLALAKAQNGNGKVYQLDGHFVTGMGNSHPVENGFLWHHTLGTPYLSGSMVKGLVRALIELYYDEADKQKKKKILYQWFGSEDKNPKNANRDSQAGELIFFDAIPTSAPTLSVDIMTPHMGDWYAEGGKITNIETDSDKIPADWHDPTPIPFLAVKNAGFLFSIAKRSPDSDINIGEVFEFLDKALTYLGAGAKTQTGYGYMSRDKVTEDTLEIKDNMKNKTGDALIKDIIKLLKIGERKELVLKLSKNINRFIEDELTRKKISIEDFCTVFYSTNQDLLEEWKESENSNEKKAYRKVMRNVQGEQP